MASVTFTPNVAGINSLFFAPSGQVQTYLEDQIANPTRDRAQRLAPRNKDPNADNPGNLARNIVVVRIPGGWVVVAQAPYAKFVHGGTRRHIILPRSAKPLSWLDEAGDRVFARRVQHPGTRPQPFLVDALKAIVASTLR